MFDEMAQQLALVPIFGIRKSFQFYYYFICSYTIDVPKRAFNWAKNDNQIKLYMFFYSKSTVNFEVLSCIFPSKPNPEIVKSVMEQGDFVAYGQLVVWSFLVSTQRNSRRKSQNCVIFTFSKGLQFLDPIFSSSSLSRIQTLQYM